MNEDQSVSSPTPPPRPLNMRQQLAAMGRLASFYLCCARSGEVPDSSVAVKEAEDYARSSVRDTHPLPSSHRLKNSKEERGHQNTCAFTDNTGPSCDCETSEESALVAMRMWGGSPPPQSTSPGDSVPTS